MVNFKEIAKKVCNKEDKLMKGLDKSIKKINLKNKVKSKRILKKGKLIVKMEDFYLQ